MTSPRRPPIVVVGAGMNGLLSAFYLLEKGFIVEVYESAQRVGGKIQTQSTFFGSRELAANALLVDGEVERVAKIIGIELQQKNPQASRRYIWCAGRLRQWPLGLWSSLRVLLFLTGRFLKLDLVCPRPNELLQDWGFRVIGQQATQNLLSPACLGIFGKDARSLSARLIYNYFFVRPERSKGQYRGSVAPVGGMEEFPKKLREYLEKKGVVFYLGKTARQKPPHPVVLATDWRAATSLLSSWKDPRSLALAQVPGVDLTSVNIFFKNAPSDVKPAFGVLFPREQKVAALGVLFNSMIFPSSSSLSAPLKGVHSETWIFGNLDHPEKKTEPGAETENSEIPAGEQPRNFLSQVSLARQRVLKDASEPLGSFVNLWPQVLPLYGLELEKVLADLPLVANDVYLMGNYLGEIGLNRFFHRARQMAEYFSNKE